jgi:hypothetical protein
LALEEAPRLARVAELVATAGHLAAAAAVAAEPAATAEDTEAPVKPAQVVAWLVQLSAPHGPQSGASA